MLVLHQKNLDSIDSINFNSKESASKMYGLTVYVKERTYFST